jgi:CheY-like chemotaxis protein
VLVAEDNPFNLEVVKTFLENENENTTVAWASNGQQAVEM